MSSNEVSVRIFVEVVNGTIGTGRYESYGRTSTAVPPAIGDSVVLEDGLKRRVVDRVWSCPDIFRGVTLYLDDPRITERHA
jgi:hypothetical protein